MSRQRSPDSKKAEKDYIKSGGTIKLVDLADKYNVAPGTVRSWKSRYNWDDEIDEDVATVKKNKKKQKQRCKKEKKKKVEKIQKKMLAGLDDADLTEKQRLFCLYYVKSYNASRSVINAGYNTDNSQRASEIGYQLLQSAPVKKEVDRLKELKRQSIMITEDDIVEQYMRTAFADITDFVDFGLNDVPLMTKEGPVLNEEGKIVMTKANIVNFKDSKMVDGGLIKEVKKGKQGISIKLEDKMKALEWLSNYFDMNPDNQHKKWYDKQRLKLNREELEFKKESEEKKNW